MKRTSFSNEEIVVLKKNPCVFNCTAKSVHYAYEFKRHALELYTQGVGPKEIWRRAGFDVSKWNKNYFVLTLRDWKRIVARDGPDGLNKLGGLQYDNAPIESFFGHMKDELDYKSCTSFEELRTKIDEYMQYYNTKRKQWARNKMTPVQYRNHLLASLGS